MKHFQQPQLMKLLFTSFKKAASHTRWLLTISVCLLTLPGMARVWFVTTTGSGSGNSWSNASGLINALDNASSGDELWVKTGTYTYNDNHSFQLLAGVKVYGGFAGTETSLNGPSGGRSTNTSAYEVIITNRTASSGPTTNSDKAVFIIETMGGVLDRLTFSNAYTSNSQADGLGAAIHMQNASAITITDVKFTNCTAQYDGGAVYMYNSKATFNRCTFTGNKSLFGTSGAMWVKENSQATIMNCSFTSNSCQYEGGAILLTGGTTGGKLIVSNSTFISNSTVRQGGAIGLRNTSDLSTFNNVVFETNRSGSGTNAFNADGSGGGLYCLSSNYTMTNCVFFNNAASGHGGAIFNTLGITSGSDLKPQITNVLFFSNGTFKGNSGAIGNDRTSANILNCTLVGNYFGSGVGSGAGGVYTFVPSGSTVSSYPTATIQNSAFKTNGYTGGGSVSTYIDIAQLNPSMSSVTYSSYVGASTAFNSGNINSADSPNPFVIPAGSVADAKGPDGIWMTADDGFHPSFCASTFIDKGNSAVVTTTTDLGGQTRRKDVTLVIDSGAGTSPIVDIGAYESQDAATSESLAGKIGNEHFIPTPQELRPDYITNTQSPAGNSSVTWQKKVGNSWADADSIKNTLPYALPTLTATTTFRRLTVATAYCNLPVYSNEITIKVVTPNGTISGQVRSTTGTGVPGINITATRKSALSGSPANKTYTTVTGNNGGYSIDPVYYGDPDVSTSRDSFNVVASKDGHVFNLDHIGIELTKNLHDKTGVDFIDKTVFTIRGRTYQQCSGCTVTNQTCPIDSITIYKDNSYNTISGFDDNDYGRYTVAVSDPSQTTIQPRFPGHTFSPASRTVTPTGNVTDQDFQDLTTHTITGKFTAGCNEYIGTAVLEFADVLPNGPGGVGRSSCFRKRVTTEAGTGNYTITLPARKYRVSVITYTPAGSSPVSDTTLKNFINTLIPPDSLTRDISTHDTTLNIAYVRAPEVSITGGLNIICMPAGGSPFALLKQSAIDSFKVVVYQGPSALGCPLADSSNKIQVLTNVQREDTLETILLPVTDTGTIVRVTGGIPNITGDHLKDFFMYFTDRYGRTTPSFNRKVLVTGVKSDQSTFTTVSPQVPLVVLHDPPGDASNSTWQSTQSITNAVRFYAAAGGGVEAWAEGKLGTKFMVGVGVATEVEVWGKIRGSVGINATTTASNEAILTATTQNTFSTSDGQSVTGSGGDVYIGAALNLIYAEATDIGFSNCAITSKRRLIIANNGFATEYTYSEDYITNYLIPNLQSIAQSNPDSSAKYLNQVKVWQQVIANNAENKRRAAFVINKSFNGGGLAVTNTTTTSSSKTSSLEFALEINATVAAELGFEVAGSGASGGVNVNFRMETGRSETNTTTNETTIGYTLKDNTDGDVFSVDIKKDPVYNTPVFELAAGTSSCPTEPGTQPRDAVFFTTNNPVVQNVAPNAPANFFLKIVNTSPSSSTNPNDKRTYKLNYVQSSNVANETITIAGTPYNSNSPYITSPLGYLDSAIVPVSITRANGSTRYSYESEVFSVSSNCDEDLGKTVAVQAYFTSPCSSINLAQPADGWVITAASNNQLFVKADGYTLSGFNTVELQYATNGSNAWTTAQTFTTTQLANGYNFDVSTLPEGLVSVRMRLNCTGGTVYSQRANGFIDRKAPQLFGRPTPTDDNYVNGETISFTYNEKLNTDANSLQITMRRLSNNALIPVTGSIYENKLVIVPNSPLTNFNGDSIRVIVSGIKDVYGNTKTMADTTGFIVGTSTPATGNQALTVSITNPTVYKNDTSNTIKVVFSLPVANISKDIRVNYNIGGTARYGTDYTATYTGADALYSSFNGSTGSIKIAANTTQATLTLRPKGGDTSYSPNKTIIISATEGGDYGLGATTSVTGNLTSEDGITTYTFNGDGNWNVKNNWLNGKMPLTTLISPKEIIIDPGGTCILNVAQTIRTGAKITVKQNRQFVIQGNLKQN